MLKRDPARTGGQRRRVGRILYRGPGIQDLEHAAHTADRHAELRIQPAQPAQAAAQATQVSPAATQVSPPAGQAQQRPTNGGSPAAAPTAAQATAKQSANGKEDDDDWWTE